MKGLRIHNSPHTGTSRAYARLSFADLFAPILPRISTIHWLYQSWPFDMADPGETTPKFPDNNGYIAPNTLLPEFARFVNDDWSSLFGFDSPPDATIIFAHLEPRDYEFMERHIAYCFFSIDGAYWDFYSHDETLLNLVSEHVATLPQTNSEQVEFADFNM